VPGKGTSLRCIFEAALLLEAKACVVMDSDLRSVTPDWVKALASPVLEQGIDFVSPFYIRHKYDATITNNVARALTQALYGRRLKQPIGGDFGLSPKLLQALTKEDVWETDVARFGVDIWMTTHAICGGFKIAETPLGAKIHDPKDPGASLGPMFRQVVGTMFRMMKNHESFWKGLSRSESVPLLGDVPSVEPEPVEISVESLKARFALGLEHFGPVWTRVLGATRFDELTAIAKVDAAKLEFPVDLWVTTVYDFAVAYAKWQGDRDQLVDMLVPIYLGRVAGFVNQSRDLSTADAEKIFDAQAQRFEELKPYLLEKWDKA
jgi:hypothetical protein